MKPALKKTLWGVLFVVGLFYVVYADIYLWKIASLGTGIEAKMLASGIFVSGRGPNSVIDQDLHNAVNFIHLEVDQINNTATAVAFGLLERTAVYRQGLGCTLLSEMTQSDLQAQMPPELIRAPAKRLPAPWPDGDIIEDDSLPDGIDTVKLDDAVDKAFRETDPDLLKNTRAVIVLYDGRIVAERYAEGFKDSNPLLGYGMTQSVANALLGVLVRQGKLDLEDTVNAVEWTEPSDPRKKIKLKHLIRMTSGLEFDDTQVPITDTVSMLGEDDMAAYAAGKSLNYEPGSHWSHSNGTTNILSRHLRHVCEKDSAEYLLFPRNELFNKIGMKRTTLEPDSKGTFVCSTYLYATARDWARFGLFYQNDGVWDGERLLPEGWVEYSTTATDQSPHGIYGAHFWLHPQGPGAVDGLSQSKLPEDAYYALGHDGQSLSIIPSHKLVVVRLGLTIEALAWDLESFLLEILEAIDT